MKKKDQEFNFEDMDWSALENELKLSDEIIEEISFEIDELPSLDLFQEDLSKFLEEADNSLLNFDSEPSSEPDPNLTVSDVVAWMKEYVDQNRQLHHHYAINHIRKHFGQQFLYQNKNGNFAISRDVLEEFLRQTHKSIVWNRGERFWRLRLASDNPNRRSVDG